MPYIGNNLATQFQAFATQTITGDGSTSYTLDRAVANGKELLVYINNVKQEEGSGKSYEASGTTITFSEAVASGDSCYLVYMGSAQQTVTAPAGSIVSSQLATAFPSASLDMNGTELILDADGDTSITSDTDDQVDIKVAGSDVIHVTSTGLGVGTNSPSAPLTISTTGSGDAVIIESTETGSSNAPDLVLHRNSASPADNDSLGIIRFRGENDASEAIDLINIFGQVTDVSDGSEDSTLFFKTYTNGAEQSPLTLVGANVGIGTTSPDSVVNIETTKTTALSSEAHFTTLGLCIDDNTAYNTALAGGGIAFRHIKNSSGDMNVYGAIDGVRIDNANGRVGGHLRFFTNNDGDGIPTERMRIDSSGILLVGKTSTSGDVTNSGIIANSGGKTIITNDGDSAQNMVLAHYNSVGSPVAIEFYRNSSVVGSITKSTSSTAYNTSSDYRLKENVVTDWDATTRLKQLKPSRFNFKENKDTTYDGFLAHEVSSIVPEAVTGKKDAMKKEVLYVDGDEIPEGKKVGDVKTPSQIDPQGIDHSKLVPLLTKALQEAISEIDTLKEKVTALESK
jgi:hypothetical protein